MQMTLAGKVFTAGLLAWVLGRSSHLKVRGSPTEVAAIKRALLASKRVQDELSRAGATVESVIEKLRLKNASAAEFQRITGVEWPL